MHLSQVPPGRPVLTSTLRLPAVQHPTSAIARNLQETLMDRDALRRIKTTARNRKLQGPVASPQRFIEPVSGPNTPPAMIAGSHKMNARRVVNKTRGQSGGI
jgi:hypothetical protein